MLTTRFLVYLFMKVIQFFVFCFHFILRSYRCFDRVIFVCFESINKHHYFSPIKQSNRIEPNWTQSHPSTAQLLIIEFFYSVQLFTSLCLFNCLLVLLTNFTFLINFSNSFVCTCTSLWYAPWSLLLIWKQFFTN